MNKTMLGGVFLLGGLMAAKLVAQTGPGGDRPPMQPSQEAFAACSDKASGATCSVMSGQGIANGTCFAPQGRPLACRPAGGAPDQGRSGPPASGMPAAPRSDQGAVIASTLADTTSILCDLRKNTQNTSANLPSSYAWSCAGGKRSLVANGIPDHAIGKFPNSGNFNTISVQKVSFETTLKPVARSGSGVRVKEPGVAINGVKFDPGTGGTCQSEVTSAEACSLGPGDVMGAWRIEALGQNTFDFGEDANNAHVQPDGTYHYHGVPEGMLSASAREGKTMALVGWASDGFPIYARFGHADAKSAKSPLRTMRSSYGLKSAPDAGRPSTRLVPMGAFMQDYRFVAGSGDLDECNGRFDVTPEFPKGIYHYYITDTYPFIQRCVKGAPGRSAEAGPPRQ